MTTIVEVAARAGVSTATVSRVLNGKAVRADLADAVRRAAADLDYFPNRTARSLRRRHSEVITLIIPDIENPFFTALARGVEDHAQESGYSVVMCNSDDDMDKESRYLAIAESENMAGVIIAATTEHPSLERWIERGRAVVAVDRIVTHSVDHVLFDNVELGRRTTTSLLRRGYTRIACIAGPQELNTSEERTAGWRESMVRAGFTAPEELLVHVNFRIEGGRAAMEQLLALPQLPDAVLATNNLVGVGALQVLTRHHFARHDVGVAVIGDLPFVTSSVDDLALMPLGARAMGCTAAEMLIERINGGAGAARRKILATPHVRGPKAPSGPHATGARR